MTVQEAAAEAGWSARMLRYVESLGLMTPQRSPSGYRIYSPEQVRDLRSLRELSERYGIELRDAGFALRLRDDPFLRHALNDLLTGLMPPARAGSGAGSGPDSGASGPSTAWLRFEQAKHERLLALSNLTHTDKEIA
jgi:DNA-binding transcriptional MerR regulator